MNVPFSLLLAAERDIHPGMVAARKEAYLDIARDHELGVAEPRLPLAFRRPRHRPCRGRPKAEPGTGALAVPRRHLMAPSGQARQQAPRGRGQEVASLPGIRPVEDGSSHTACRRGRGHARPCIPRLSGRVKGRSYRRSVIGSDVGSYAYDNRSGKDAPRPFGINDFRYTGI